jgi:chromosome segregation ATPase
LTVCIKCRTYHVLLSEVFFYEHQLQILGVEIQAAERRRESGARARHEALDKVLSIQDEYTEISSVIKVCSARLADSKNEPKTALQALRRELKCNHAKKKQLGQDLDRHTDQLKELLDSNCVVPTLIALHKKRSDLKNQLRARLEYMSSDEGMISGLFLILACKSQL